MDKIFKAVGMLTCGVIALYVGGFFVLSSIATYNITKSLPERNAAEARKCIGNIIAAQALYRAAHGMYAPSLDTLVRSNPALGNEEGEIEIPFYDLEHSADESTFRLDAVPSLPDHAQDRAFTLTRKAKSQRNYSRRAGKSVDATRPCAESARSDFGRQDSKRT